MAKILIADDALFVRKSMIRILTSSGHQLFEAEDGKQAIEIYKEQLPDLVIMNIVMPVLDGISAVKEIRKINPEAKIIMCSAMGQQKKIAAAIQAGATDFIAKPYKDAQVLDAVNNVLGLI